MRGRWSVGAGLLALVASAAAVGIKGNVVTGTIVDWPAGTTGAVHLLMDWNDDKSALQTKTQLDRAGEFSVTLPDLKATGLSAKLPRISGLFGAKSSYNPDCSGTGTVTPDTGTFKGFWLMISQGGQRLGDIDFRNNADATWSVGTVMAELMYFSETTTLNGKLTCRQGENFVFQGTFPAGWNLVRGELVAGQVPGERVWQYTSAGSMQSLSWRLYTEISGIGLNLKLGEQGELTIDNVRPGQPAEQTGLKVGDVIVGVDGKRGLTLDETLVAVRGKPGTEVVLMVRRPGEAADLTFKITRSLIRFP